MYLSFDVLGEQTTVFRMRYRLQFGMFESFIWAECTEWEQILCHRQKLNKRKASIFRLDCWSESNRPQTHPSLLTRRLAREQCRSLILQLPSEHSLSTSIRFSCCIAGCHRHTLTCCRLPMSESLCCHKRWKKLARDRLL